MSAEPFHLAWFLNGFKVNSWRDQWSGVGGYDLWSPDFYIEFARSLERAGFDYLILEDSSFVPDAYQDSSEVYLKHAQMVPKFDPAVLAAMLSQFTTRLGIVTTLSTSEYQPYMLARQIATLDHMTRGRAGWNIVTGSSDRAAQNYGRDALPPHDERYAIAAEMVDVVTQLWHSWQPDAVVADRESGVFADYTKVHTVNFEGRYFKSRGPLNIPRPPQGRPVLVQAGASPKGRAFASQWADTIIGYNPIIEGMKEYRDSVRTMALSHGRKPDDVKVLFLVNPVLGSTDAEAEEIVRRERQESYDDPTLSLAMMGFATNIDFSKLELDVPVVEQASSLATNGHQSVLDGFIARAGNRTLREMMSGDNGAPQVVGTPETVAAKLDEMMQEIGGDGFLFSLEGMTRRHIAEVTDGLVPALQRRGLVRRTYTHEHFRDNLFEF